MSTAMAYLSGMKHGDDAMTKSTDGNNFFQEFTAVGRLPVRDKSSSTLLPSHADQKTYTAD
ncbi:hypothetical protein BV898_19025, partial [Hypsibius exemplaris]